MICVIQQAYMERVGMNCDI